MKKRKTNKVVAVLLVMKAASAKTVKCAKAVEKFLSIVFYHIGI